MKVKSLTVLSMAAVSFLVGCGGSDADKKFIDDINNALNTEKASVTTPSSAVKAVKEKGFDINSYTLKNKNYEIAFDIDTKQFTLMLGDTVSHAPSGYNKNSNSYHIFKFVDNYDNRSTYSQYLTRNFKGSDLLVVTTGLDMGENNNVKNITYFNNTGNSKDIILNVNCDYLNISTTSDNIYHYGDANNVFIPSTLTGNYHEYGSCCYIQASGGTVYLEAGSYTDLFEIPDDYVNAVTVKQAETSKVLARFNADIRAESTIKCCEINNDKITASELQILLNNTDYNFYRLTTEASDIVLTNSAIEFNRSLFFDLNGRSITFDCGGTPYSVEGETHYPGIHVRSATSNEETQIDAFLIDTQSSLYQRSGINLLDCSIIIEGNEDESKPVSFYMDSGKIHDVKCSKNVTGARNIPAVLVLGNISNNASRSEKWASFNMYGGYIKTEWGANKDKEISGAVTYKTQIACKCIQPRGKGASINMVYGDLESFHYCISGKGQANLSLDVDKDGDTSINIIGGNLIGGKEVGYNTGTGEDLGYIYTTIFIPQSGTVNISGANFTGPSCINAKASDIKINGGVFNATLDPYNDDAKATTDGSRADGSVIFMEANGGYKGPYITPLNITVEYATMTSKTGYIVKCFGYTTLKKTSITFIDGVFNYKKDKFATDMTEQQAKEYFECTINGGTWNKVA